MINKMIKHFLFIFIAMLLCVLPAYAKDNFIRLPDDISITLPDTWIIERLDSDKSTLFSALKLASNGSAVAYLSITRVYVSMPITQAELSRMDERQKGIFLDGFTKDYLKSATLLSPDIKNRQLIGADVFPKHGVTMIGVITSATFEGSPIFIETRLVGFKDRLVQMTIWHTAYEHEYLVIAESFIPGKP